jgi:hypothetical protein
MISYVYIIVRKDIKKEYQLVQACHAALEAGFAFSAKEGVIHHLVVLEVANEWELDEVSICLNEENIKFKKFYESWRNIGNTALATEPIVKQSEGILRSLPLYKL